MFKDSLSDIQLEKAEKWKERAGEVEIEVSGEWIFFKVGIWWLIFFYCLEIYITL